MKQINYNNIKKQKVKEGLKNGEIGIITKGYTFEIEAPVTLIVEYNGDDELYYLYFKTKDTKILVPGEMYSEFDGKVKDKIREMS